jgi:hypothetical protein
LRAITTRRYPDKPRADGSFESHPSVIKEMTTARAWSIKTIEAREEKVKIGDGNDAVMHLLFAADERDKLMVELATRLADFKDFKKKTVIVQLLPPAEEEIAFRKQALRGAMTCEYEIESGGQILSCGAAKVRAIKAGYFVDIEVPTGEFVVKLEIKKIPAGAWMSLGDALIAIPINLYDA